MFRGLVAVAALGAFGMFLAYPETRRIGRLQWRQHLGHGVAARVLTMPAACVPDLVLYAESKEERRRRLLYDTPTCLAT